MIILLNNNNAKCEECGLEFKLGETHTIIDYDEDVKHVYFKCTTEKCNGKVKLVEKEHTVFL